jgi:hypothetical protein
MIGILVFANWGKPQDVSVTLNNGINIQGTVQKETETQLFVKMDNDSIVKDKEIKSAAVADAGKDNKDNDSVVYKINKKEIKKREVPAGMWSSIYNNKWYIASMFSVILAVVLVLWFGVKAWMMAVLAGGVIVSIVLAPQNHMLAFVIGFVGLSVITSKGEGECGEWFSSSWTFAKQILPLLLAGVVVAGLLLGRPENEGLIPSEWIASAVGGNSVWANLFAAVAGAFMYFATLTEIPILQGLIGSGMGKGPALSLLLAGPALSLPNMLVIRSVMGTKKTVVFVLLVVIMATLSGVLFGMFFA